MSKPAIARRQEKSDPNALHQESELTLRTAELLENNAEQALTLLIQYAQSSRKQFHLSSPS